MEAIRRWVREQGISSVLEGSFERLDALRDESEDQGEDDAKLRDVLGESAPQIAKLAPEIESRLGPFPPRPELPAHEERLLFFDAVTHLFAKLARRQGLLFYLDDLHWADSGTLWLLGHLIRNLREERVLILASYRDTELDRAHPLAKALVDWNRERFTTRIVLNDSRGRNARTDRRAVGRNISGDFSEASIARRRGTLSSLKSNEALIEQARCDEKADAGNVASLPI